MAELDFNLTIYQSHTWENRQPGRQEGERSSLPITPVLNKQFRVRELNLFGDVTWTESPPMAVLNNVRGTKEATVKCGNILCGMWWTLLLSANGRWITRSKLEATDSDKLLEVTEHKWKGGRRENTTCWENSRDSLLTSFNGASR
jgi:hypothetical protein